MNIHQLQGQNTNNAHSVMALTDTEKQVVQQHSDAESDKFYLLCEKYGDHYCGEPFTIDKVKSHIAKQFGVSFQDVSIRQRVKSGFLNFTGFIEIRNIPHAFAIDQAAIQSQLHEIAVLRHRVIHDQEDEPVIKSSTQLINPLIHSVHFAQAVDHLTNRYNQRPYQDMYLYFMGGKLYSALYGHLFFNTECIPSINYYYDWALDEILLPDQMQLDYTLMENHLPCLDDLVNFNILGDYTDEFETSMDFEDIYAEISSTLFGFYRKVILPQTRLGFDRFIKKMINGDKNPVIPVVEPEPMMTVPTYDQMLSMQQKEHKKMLADKVQKAADHRAQKNYELMHDDRPWAR